MKNHEISEENLKNLEILEENKKNSKSKVKDCCRTKEILKFQNIGENETNTKILAKIMRNSEISERVFINLLITPTYEIHPPR